MTERRLRRRECGFSLLEVVVAFAIMTLSLTVVFGIYSTAFRSSASAERYRLAAQIADSTLREQSVLGAAGAAGAAGTVDDLYTWRTQIRPLAWRDARDDRTHPLTPYELTVTVSWEDAGHSRAVSLTTVRLEAAP